MAFNRPLVFGIIPTWGNWLGKDWAWDAQMLAEVAESGCQLAHVDSGWNKVWGGQTEPPNPNWVETDHEVDAIIAAGMTPYIRLTETPAWAAEDSNTRNPPREEADIIAKFNSFHTAIADRYKTKASYFEFENETNRDNWIDTTKFGRWLLRARTSLKQGNSAAILIAGSTWGVDPNYLSQVYDYCAGQGVSHPFDRVAIHPYNYQGPIDTNAITAYRNTMVAKGDGSTNMWVTEWGWAVAPGGVPYVSQDQAAQHIADAFSKICFSGSYNYVDGMAYHQFLDIPTSNSFWGLCNDDLSPRPGYLIFKAWTVGALESPELRARGKQQV